MLGAISEIATLLKIFFRSNHRRCSIKIESFANFTGKHLCWSVFLIKLQLYLKETLAQMFSCKVCEIFGNTYFEKHLRTTAPEETPLLEVFES